jgi:Uma2 family endonuclease
MPDFDGEGREVRAVSAVAVEHVGPWTIEDLFALPEDGQRHELVDGSLLVTPAPGMPHQRASSRLWAALDAAVPDEFEVLEAVNVQTGKARLFIPDVVVIRCPGTTATVLPAAEVLLVAEIVSPSSVAIDRTLKPAMYAAAGIPHYLRVELEGDSAPTVFAYTLAGDAYQEMASARVGEILDLHEPFRVSIDPGALLGRRR